MRSVNTIAFEITFDQHIKLFPLSALFILICISILVAVGFLSAFLWSVKNGQYDDDYTPSIRILFDDNKVIPKSSTPSKKLTQTKK